jgi:hypothetical protein
MLRLGRLLLEAGELVIFVLIVEVLLAEAGNMFTILLLLMRATMSV